MIDFIISYIFVLSLFLFFYGMMYVSRRENDSRVGSFDITPANKDKSISLVQYKKDIQDFLNMLSYQEEACGEHAYVFHPARAQRVEGGDIHIQFHPFYISVEGPFSITSVLGESLSTCGSSFSTIEEPQEDLAA